jgi:hypothetical protein
VRHPTALKQAASRNDPAASQLAAAHQHQHQPAVHQLRLAVPLQLAVQNQFAAVKFDPVVCVYHVSDAAASLSAATKEDSTGQLPCAIRFYHTPFLFK